MADTYVNTAMASSHITSLMRRINALEAGLTGTPGVFITQFGLIDSTPVSGELATATGRFARDGYMYVCDSTENKINKFTVDGTFVLSFTVNASGSSAVPGPFSVYVDATNIYSLEDSLSLDVAKYDLSGNFVSVTALSGAGASTGHMESDGSGGFFVSNTTTTRINKYNSSGTLTLTIGTTGVGAGQFQSPRGMCLDGSGNIYVCDATRDKLIKFDSSGAYVAEVGTSGAGAGQFQSPFDVCFDGTYLYVQDTTRQYVLSFDTSLSYITEYNGNSYTSNCQHIAVDEDGYIYFGSVANGKYACVKFSGETVTGGEQTTFFSYTETEKTSLGIPDGGVSIPALAALTPANNNADLVPRHITDMRNSIEVLAPYFTNPATSAPYTWAAADPNNLYYVAMGDRTEYGATGGAAYDWTRTEAQMEGDYAYSLDIGEVASCLDQLEAS